MTGAGGVPDGPRGVGRISADVEKVGHRESESERQEVQARPQGRLMVQEGPRSSEEAAPVSDPPVPSEAGRAPEA